MFYITFTKKIVQGKCNEQNHASMILFIAKPQQVLFKDNADKRIA